MSKGLGQKIAIKFTADLIGDVSGKDTATPYSFYRWYITSTWSSSGRLYLYELEFFSNGVKMDTNKIVSMAGSSRYSSNYDVDRLFDGSVSGREWDANGPLPHWVSIELDEAIVIDSFRWHTGTSGNKPREFILQGSNDGINWVDIYTDESQNLNNWINFDVPVGNAAAFTVTGKEYQYVNGPLVDKEYRVEKVERYPIAKLWRDDFSGQMDGVEVGENGLQLEWSEDTDYSAPNDQIRLVMHPQSRFNNVVGPLTVQYDQTVGSLRGRSGPVEGFIETFTPIDLEPKPNPHVAENIEVSAEANVNFTKVICDQGYTDEYITVSASATADFIYVGIINP